MGDWVRLYSQYIYKTMANEYLDKTGLNTFWQLIKTAINTLITMVNGKADKSHTHSSISSGNVAVITDDDNIEMVDNNGDTILKVFNASDNKSGVEIFGTGSGTSTAEFSDSTTKIMSPDTNNTIRVNDDVIRIKYGGTGHTQEVKIDGTEVKIKQSGSDDVALQIKADETSLKYGNSMGVRLKSTSTECKFSGKGLTIDASNSKLTAASKVRLIAPTIEISNGDDGDAALTLNGDNIGDIVQRLNVQPHVELMFLDNELYIVCDKGYLTAADEVRLFRYTRGTVRYRHKDNSSELNMHKRKIGWRQPRRQNGNIYSLSLYNCNSLFGNITTATKDVWAVHDNDIDGNIGVWLCWSGSGTSIENTFFHNVKLGVRIQRDGVWITDYLPFMVTEAGGSVGIGRWKT